jgi:hypothetical protein
MAYDGLISYMDDDEIPFAEVEWNDAVQFPTEDELVALVREFRHCRIERGNTECAIVDEVSVKRGLLRYDGADSTDIQTLKCVIIGRELSVHKPDDEREYYVLVVTPRCSKEICRTYERVGVGSIQGRHISFDGQGVEARIV